MGKQPMSKERENEIIEYVKSHYKIQTLNEMAEAISASKSTIYKLCPFIKGAGTEPAKKQELPEGVKLETPTYPSDAYEVFDKIMSVKPENYYSLADFEKFVESRGKSKVNSTDLTPTDIFKDNMFKFDIYFGSYTSFGGYWDKFLENPAKNFKEFVQTVTNSVSSRVEVTLVNPTSHSFNYSEIIRYNMDDHLIEMKAKAMCIARNLWYLLNDMAIPPALNTIGVTPELIRVKLEQKTYQELTKHDLNNIDMDLYDVYNMLDSKNSTNPQSELEFLNEKNDILNVLLDLREYLSSNNGIVQKDVKNVLEEYNPVKPIVLEPVYDESCYHCNIFRSQAMVAGIKLNDFEPYKLHVGWHSAIASVVKPKLEKVEKETETKEQRKARIIQEAQEKGLMKSETKIEPVQPEISKKLDEIKESQKKLDETAQSLHGAMRESIKVMKQYVEEDIKANVGDFGYIIVRKQGDSFVVINPETNKPLSSTEKFIPWIKTSMEKQK